MKRGEIHGLCGVSNFKPEGRVISVLQVKCSPLWTVYRPRRFMRSG